MEFVDLVQSFSNDYSIAAIVVDTAENGPSKVKRSATCVGRVIWYPAPTQHQALARSCPDPPVRVARKPHPWLYRGRSRPQLVVQVLPKPAAPREDPESPFALPQPPITEIVWLPYHEYCS